MVWTYTKVTQPGTLLRLRTRSSSTQFTTLSTCLKTSPTEPTIWWICSWSMQLQENCFATPRISRSTCGPSIMGTLWNGKIVHVSWSLWTNTHTWKTSAVVAVAHILVLKWLTSHILGACANLGCQTCHLTKLRKHGTVQKDWTIWIATSWITSLKGSSIMMALPCKIWSSIWVTIRVMPWILDAWNSLHTMVITRRKLQVSEITSQMNISTSQPPWTYSSSWQNHKKNGDTTLSSSGWDTSKRPRITTGAILEVNFSMNLPRAREFA